MSLHKTRIVLHKEYDHPTEEWVIFETRYYIVSIVSAAINEMTIVPKLCEYSRGKLIKDVTTGAVKREVQKVYYPDDNTLSRFTPKNKILMLSEVPYLSDEDANTLKQKIQSLVIVGMQ